MNSPLEQDLRRALIARAAELPADASARLLSVDYRPRGGVPRPALAAGCATVAAGAAVAIVTVGLGTSTPRAFAGWTAAPTHGADGKAQGAEPACRTHLPTSAGIERAQHTASGAHRPWPIPRFAATDWRTVLVDVRGPYTLILFEAAQGRAEFTCFSGRKPGQQSLGGSFGIRLPAPVADGKVSTVSSGSNTTPPDEGSHQFSQLVGRTGAGVKAVRLKFEDRARVTASTANGWFLAWWPGRHFVTALEVTTSTGTRVQPFGDKSVQMKASSR